MAKDTLVMSWKDIAGYEGYQAHPDGMIRNKKTGETNPRMEEKTLKLWSLQIYSTH